jgi:hypothetical protein
MSDNSSSNIGTFGIIGDVFAGILSYLKWGSLKLAFWHVLCGWIYVVYYTIRYHWPS